MDRRFQTMSLARLGAGLVFLLISAGDAAGVRTCPHHLGSDAGSSAEAVEYDAHSGHGGDEDTNHACTCLGVCLSGTTGDVAPASSTAGTDYSYVGRLVLVSEAAPSKPARKRAPLLPDATGPPLRL